MPLDIIGAGLPRTGTESLKHALEQLGCGACYHMTEVIAHPQHVALWEASFRGEVVDFEVLFKGYRAAVDFPAMAHWKTLAERYPEARVILTVRDPEQWYRSLCATVLSAAAHLPANDPVTCARRQMVREALLGGVFEGRSTEPEFMHALFERHRHDVTTHIAPQRLLVFDVREGWAPLCDFLSRPQPDTPFPRGNATAEFRRKYLAEAS